MPSPAAVTAPAQLVVVSDSHLSGRASEAERNWSAVVDHVHRTRPDLVVHVGDLSLDGENDAEDLDYAVEQLGRLSPAPGSPSPAITTSGTTGSPAVIPPAP